MKRVFGHAGGWLSVAGLALFWMASRPGMVAAEAPPAADEIMRRAVARAEAMAAPDGQPNYHFTRRTVTDELDMSGNLREHTEKLFDVAVTSARTRMRLVEINGRPPSAADLKKQQLQDETEQKKIAESRSGEKKNATGNLFTTELISRYDFTLAGTRDIRGRPAYYLTFKPKANLPVHKITDRFLNQVAGRVWIDTQEFEVARAEIRLQSEVTLWAGIIGTLRKCDFTLERIRLPDGAWFAGSSHGLIEGRKFLDNLFVRTRSESTNFRRDGLAMR